MESENVASKKSVRRRRADGERSREAILVAAAKLATIRGLEGMSLGELATELGISKSGLFAHFGSKEELELATIETAERIFTKEVVEPVLAAGRGLARLRTLIDATLSYLERRVFPGGCFFVAVAAELAARRGRTRDRVRAFIASWMQLIERCLHEARDLGEIEPTTDIAQTAFEVRAALTAANTAFVMDPGKRVLDMAREGAKHVIERVRPRD
jgi:AcrR family transcriptional regulator